MGDQVINCHLVMPTYSSCKSCRNDTLRAGGKIILEPFRSRLLSDVRSCVLSKYLWVILGMFLHIAGPLLFVNL